jgi:aminopeptidase YwaD
VECNIETDAAGARLGNSSLLLGEFGSSDHAPFHKVGIPAVMLANGIDAERACHTFQDTLAENISLERMQNALDVAGATVFDLIRKQVAALERSRVGADE